jgi:chitosanase
MILNKSQKSVIERVVNVFETGSPVGNYAAIAIFNDGPNKIRQITYGRSQTTEYGNLRELVRNYANVGGTFSTALAPFVNQIGKTPLTDNAAFKDLLHKAGQQDPVMKHVQDAFFEARYFQPAQAWADQQGFRLPLSMLVIYDSFIHSGSIRPDIRQMFSEVPPARGGDEKAWTTAYVNARHKYLANNPNPQVRPTVYRTECFKEQIRKQNWKLDILPILAHGTNVTA